MLFEEYKPFPVKQWGSLVDSESPALLPLDIAVEARNVRFTRAGVRSRDGIETDLQMANTDQPVSGIAELVYIAATGKVPLVLLFDRGGRLEYESPVGSGATVPLVSTIYTPPSGMDMIAALAQNKAFGVFSDLQIASTRLAVIDGSTQTINPAAGRPIGEAWTAVETYLVGELIAPTVPNGHLYRATTAGASGAAEPVWPTAAASTVVDGAVTWQEFVATPVDTVAAGNICLGKHYAFVTYKTRTGFVYGITAAAVFSWTAAGGKKVTVPLPIGPENVVARIVNFTVAGAAAAGDFFWIPLADSVEGIAISSTVINDNTSTSVTLDFTDDYLGTGRDGDKYFNSARAPKAVSCYYDRTLTRLVLTGCPGFESGHLLSDPTDLETFNSVSGVVQVAENDGKRTMGWFEFENLHYSVKEHSGHICTPSDVDPRKWSVVMRWENAGMIGPLALDVGNDFVIFVHRSGVYLFMGNKPINVTNVDIDKTFRRLNLNAGHKVWVKIDDEQKEVLVGLPLDDNLECSHVLKMNFLAGFDAPMADVTRFAKTKIQSIIQSRKWSVDEIPATRCIRASRRLAATTGDDELDNTQLLYATDNGAVNRVREGSPNDNGNGIDAVYETGSATAGGMLLDIGGVRVKADGIGELDVALLLDEGSYNVDPNDRKVRRLRNIDFSLTPNIPQDRGLIAQASAARMRFSNGKRKGHRFELQSAVLYAKALGGGR